MGKYKTKEKSEEIKEDLTARELQTVNKELNLSPTESPQLSKINFTEKEIRSTGKIFSKLTKHIFVVIFIITLAYITHYLLKNVFGDPKFFDIIPIRWVIDAGDIAIIVTFVIIVIRELWDTK